MTYSRCKRSKAALRSTDVGRLTHVGRATRCGLRPFHVRSWRSTFEPSFGLKPLERQPCVVRKEQPNVGSKVRRSVWSVRAVHQDPLARLMVGLQREHSRRHRSRLLLRLCTKLVTRSDPDRVLPRGAILPVAERRRLRAPHKAARSHVLDQVERHLPHAGHFGTPIPPIPHVCR